MTKTTEQTLAASLTARSTELLPHLPYLLQDLWTLGGSPEYTCDILYKRLPKGARVLDLACGKGAVAVHLAKEMGVQVKGVDLMPAFVEEARQKAQEDGVAGLCTFEVGDVNAAVGSERGYDAVVFSAAGDVLGPPAQMLAALAGVVKPGGYVVLDESHLPEENGEAMHYENYEMLTYGSWRRLFAENGLKELVKLTVEEDVLAEGNRADMEAIEKRARELAERYPEKQKLFAEYVESQWDEVYDVENSLVNALWLLQKRD